MATETDLVDLFDSLAERAPSVQDVLDRMPPAPDRAPRPSRPWVPVVAAVAAAAAVAVSVVILRGDDSRSGDAAGPPPVVDQASYAMPLDRYHASVAQTLTIRRAEFALVQRCAQQHGVALPNATFHADEGTSFLISLANNIRPVTAQQARTYGYGFPSHDSSTVNSVVAALTPSQREIVTGWQRGGKSARPSDQFLLRGGCFGAADQTLLAGATPPSIPNVGTIPVGGHTLFDDDVNVQNTYVNLGYPGNLTAPVQQAQRRWATCMADHGYAGLRSTTDAIAKFDSDQPTAAARRAAVQDVRCKEATGFMTVWVASMRKAQNAVLAAHRAQLEPFARRLAVRLANAAKALR